MKYEDDFEGMLNEALSEVREAEPRVGLEGRVLAGVRASAGERRVGWWKWLAVAAMVVLIVLSASVRRGSKVNVVRKDQPVKAVAPEKSWEEAVKAPAEPKPFKRRAVAVKVARRKVAMEPVLVAKSNLPFPVPTPLTEEEKALQRWAGRRPEVLVKLNEEQKATEEKPITISPIEMVPINGGEK